MNTCLPQAEDLPVPDLKRSYSPINGKRFLVGVKCVPACTDFPVDHHAVNHPDRPQALLQDHYLLTQVVRSLPVADGPYIMLLKSVPSRLSCRPSGESGRQCRIPKSIVRLLLRSRRKGQG
jgi:hypothetical protein